MNLGSDVAVNQIGINAAVGPAQRTRFEQKGRGNVQRGMWFLQHQERRIQCGQTIIPILSHIASLSEALRCR